VNYQLLGLCRAVVASQEIEPGDGWPYDAILKKVVSTPDMAIENIAKLIVEEYTAYYSSRFPSTTVTQSAISMDGIQTLTSAIDELAKSLTSSMTKRTGRGLISDALRYAQTFRDRDYIDLTHFCQLLARGHQGEVGAAARKVVKIMLEPGSPVIASRSSGYGVENIHGLSIYLPGRFLSPAYDRLDFAQQNAWGGFLKEWSGPRI
jgi:hypothetical protein